MYAIFFQCLQILNENKDISFNLSCVMEHLWWEWSAKFDLYNDFAIMYYYELGDLLHLFLSHVKSQTEKYTRQHFLMRYQSLSRCLDYYDYVLTPKYNDLSQNTVLMIKGSHQQLLSIYDNIHPQSASSASDEKCSGPGTRVKEDNI